MSCENLPKIFNAISVFVCEREIAVIRRIEKFCSYVTENTLRLHYKIQTVRVVQETNLCLLPQLQR